MAGLGSGVLGWLTAVMKWELEFLRAAPLPGGGGEWSKALLLGPSGSCSKSLRCSALLWEV